jgi:sulfate permease, SulP family
MEVLANYADKLAEVNGRLYLSGINEDVHDQLVRAGKLRLSGPVQIYEATPVRLEATRKAVADARAWLVGASTETEAGESQR